MDPRKFDKSRLSHDTVGKRQRSQLSIIHPIARGAKSHQKLEGLAQMLVASNYQLHRRLPQPRSHMPGRFRRRHGIQEDCKRAVNPMVPNLF